MKKQFKYLVISILTFILGIVILIFFKNHVFIRGFIGDFLAVIFLYTLLKIFFIKKRAVHIFLITMFISLLLEFFQYIEILKILNINSRVLNIILGSTFDLNDILAYFLGVVFIFAIDIFLIDNKKN